MQTTGSKTLNVASLLLAILGSFLIATSGVWVSSSSPEVPRIVRSERGPYAAGARDEEDPFGAYAQEPEFGRYADLQFKFQIEQNTRDLQSLIANYRQMRRTPEFLRNPAVRKTIELQLKQMESGLSANQKLVATFESAGELRRGGRQRTVPTALVNPENETPAVWAWLPIAQLTSGTLSVLLALFVILFGNDLLTKRRARKKQLGDSQAQTS